MVQSIYNLRRCHYAALRLLRKLGWVHRDVSIGNILFSDGHAKLADLEYAKKMGDSKSHESGRQVNDRSPYPVNH